MMGLKPFTDAAAASQAAFGSLEPHGPSTALKSPESWSAFAQIFQDRLSKPAAHRHERNVTSQQRS